MTLLAAWSVVVGLSVLALAAYAVYGLQVIPRALAAFLGAPYLLVALAGLVTLLEVVTALGLWWLRRWGWVFAIGFSIDGIVLGALTLPLGIAGVAFGLVSLAYLGGREVRLAFGFSAREGR